jgi:CRP/FNR family transcriptional regulator, cyclic AMP receptor protein
MPDASPSPPSILTGLPANLLARLFADATPRRLRVDEQLFRIGDRGDGCYRLQSGLLKLMVESPEGEELIIAFLGPDAMVGELAVIDGLPRSATAIAVTSCELSFVTRLAFDECMRAHPEVYRCVAETLAARLRQTDDALAAASFLDSNGRVARALLELAALLGEETADGRVLITHPIRQRDLAAMAGIARENVSRIVSGWKARNLVTQVQQYSYIIDVARLEREVERHPRLPASAGWQVEGQRDDAKLLPALARTT